MALLSIVSCHAPTIIWSHSLKRLKISNSKYLGIPTLAANIPGLTKPQDSCCGMNEQYVLLALTAESARPGHAPSEKLARPPMRSLGVNSGPLRRGTPELVVRSQFGASIAGVHSVDKRLSSL